MATLHANSANQAMDRIINFFPEAKRQQLLMDLSLNMKCIMSQRLIPTADQKGRCAAIEILMNTPMVQSLIFKGLVHDLKEQMKKGAKHGMRTFDQALFDLFESGQTTIEDTLRNADSLNELKLYIKLNSKRAGNAKDSKPRVDLSILGEEKSENEDGRSNFMRKEDPPSESSQSQ